MSPSNKSRNLLEASSSVVLKHEKGFYYVSEVKRLVDTNPGWDGRKWPLESHLFSKAFLGLSVFLGKDRKNGHRKMTLLELYPHGEFQSQCSREQIISDYFSLYKVFNAFFLYMEKEWREYHYVEFSRRLQYSRILIRWIFFVKQLFSLCVLFIRTIYSVIPLLSSPCS